MYVYISVISIEIICTCTNVIEIMPACCELCNVKKNIDHYIFNRKKIYQYIYMGTYKLRMQKLIL